MLTKKERDHAIFTTNQGFKQAYPMTSLTRKSLGSVPVDLHKEIFAVARRENVSIGVLLASMLSVFESAK